MEYNTKKRLPKFRRAGEARPGLKLQPRDLDILKTVHHHRFLNSDHIRALIPGSDQVITRRLQKLFHAGYLDRPLSQIRITTPGPEKLVYGISTRGADLLCRELGLPREKTDWTTKNRGVKQPYLWHTIMVANFRVVLTTALKATGDFELLFWKQGQELRDHVYIQEGQGRKERVSVYPDAFFGIKDSREGIEKTKLYFFLEADRSTMALNRFLKKMRGYWRYLREEKHTKKHGIGHFRVLTINNSPIRKENLRQITTKATDNQKGSALYWFGLESHYSLEKPEAILDNIWQTAENDHWRSILE